MASKQLGKLRQWAGEVISSREKTAFSDEFKEVEKHIDIRKQAADRIAEATDAYYRNLSKKKDSADDSEKMLPLDAVGVCMIVHGEEIGEDNEFGHSLIKFGRAHCKAATLQEAYALNLKETFVDSLDQFFHDVKDYEVQRKKLESRRLAYDAAITKLEKLKAGKKEKERVEAEDEVERAKYRFDETTEDVRAHMALIQEREANLMHALTNFLNLELQFVQKYLEVLQETKEEWTDQSSPTTSTRPRRLSSTPTITRKKSSSSKFGSMRSKNGRPSSPNPSASGSEDEDATRSSRSRRGSESQTHRRRQSEGSKSRSRPGSSSGPSSSTNNNTGKDDKPSLTSRFSVSGVAGWASSAVGGVTGRNRKDRDQFANLDEEHALEDDDEKPETEPSSSVKTSSSLRSGISRRLSRSKSTGTSNNSPKVPPRVLKPAPNARIVRALYDFNGSADELRFKAGEEIRVINEVLDDWWMGEVVGGTGKQGLFPTTFVDKDPHSDGESVGTQDDIYDRQPMSATSGMFLGVGEDAMSITSADETQGLMGGGSVTDSRDGQARKILSALDSGTLRGGGAAPRPIPRRTNSDTSSTSGSASASASVPKKPPPPPPPRRTQSNTLVPPPSLPPRRPAVVRSHSSTASFSTARSEISFASGDVDYDTSPFESAADIGAGHDEGECQNFKQNPFKPKGLCSNCFQYHEV